MNAEDANLDSPRVQQGSLFGDPDPEPDPEPDLEPWPEPESDPETPPTIDEVVSDSDPEDSKQGSLFGDLDEFYPWKKEWQGMPEFIQEDLAPKYSVIVHFESMKDMQSFAKLVEQNISGKTQSLWYPEAKIGTFADKRYKYEP